MKLDQLIINFQKKDIKAYEELYNMYAESMYGVVFNIIRNKEESEEVVQDVFIKAWNSSDNYSSKKGRFFTWLLSISRNAAIDKIRSKDFKRSKQNLDATFFVDILEASENLDAKLDAMGIKKFVESLKEKCKNLIELIYFQGFTQKEASDELAIPLGTVKTNNRKCISELRAKILY